MFTYTYFSLFHVPLIDFLIYEYTKIENTIIYLLKNSYIDVFQTDVRVFEKTVVYLRFSTYIFEIYEKYTGVRKTLMQYS